MRFDLGWLNEQLDGEPEPDLLAERLTACGFNVEVREPVAGTEVWDVDVTTNRPDAMNHRGLAREAAVACGIGLRSHAFEMVEAGDPASTSVAVAVDDPERCSRYVARVVRGVRMVQSPQWLRARLERCGVRPINAVVDATNLVLLELGQPLHAFDLDLLAGRRIIVRRARPGERLVTLDGVERTLTDDMLVIADGERAVGLAGVMGGANTEISERTVDVVLESAHFEASGVRRTARALGMHTEASHRFERGADPEMAAWACDAAAALIARLTGARVAPERIDVHPRPRAAAQIELSVPALGRFAGLDYEPAEVAWILDGLGFAPDAAGDRITCTVPSWRVDVERTADLYEEVIRHVGYDAVPAVLPVLPTPPGERCGGWGLVDRARDAAVCVGLVEVVTYAFIDEASDALVTGSAMEPGDPLPLVNPLARTQSTMRRSLLPGLLGGVREALNQGESGVAVFEEGRIFWQRDDRPGEAERLAIALAGVHGSWQRVEPVGFASLKGVVEAVCGGIPMPLAEWRRGGGPWLEPGQGAEILSADGRVVGIAGRLADGLQQLWGLRQPVWVAELDLRAAAQPGVTSYQPLPRFPAVSADVTVEHDRALAFSELERTAREAAAELVERLELTARFEGEGLPAGRVRTTLRIVYRHPDRSLTQDEVNTMQAALRQQLAERLGVDFA
jgi:phenylalanyl-tRNA synthetase beta chain